MAYRHCSPLAFLLSGFCWLALSSVLGMAILIGLVLGIPLPPWVRQVHVHAGLIGGVIQMVLGGVLAMIPASGAPGPSRQQHHPILFLAINGGTAAILAGFWLRHLVTVSAAGMLIACAYVWSTRVVWVTWRQSLPSPPNRWYYAAAVLALFGGIGCGEALSLSLAHESYGYVRLAHIHLGLLGFVIPVIVGAMYTMVPAVLHVPLSSPRLAHIVLFGIPLGTGVLIAGFMNASVVVEIAAGGILLVGGILYAASLFQTWLASSCNGTAASDHLLISTFFLLVMIVLGILVGINNLSNPPALPYGTLHLVAYTHTALLGFVVNTAMGLLSYEIPLLLAASRVASNKKRGPYRERLSAIMNRWRSIQIGTLCLGTMGLGVVASLTWNVPLNSPYVRAATWTCFVCLLTSFLLFSAKLAMAIGQQPEIATQSPAH